MPDDDDPDHRNATPHHPFVASTIDRALASAGLDGSSPLVQAIRQTLQRALHGHPGAAAPAPTPTPADEGDRAQWREYRNHAGARRYRICLPEGRLAATAPVVVMLHGCTQSAADFALGTGMDERARRHGCIVVYPEQALDANAGRCWNWFQPGDQRRDAGEPALIAGIVNEVLERDGGDRSRVFVAGLSAGAAMAVVLGETYPELFAGVGAHSGLPYAAAHDTASALAAMKGGHGRRGGAPAPRPQVRHAPRTIVFHGDRDTTVQHRNSEHIVQQVLQARSGRQPHERLQSHTRSGRASGGREYTVQTHLDAGGQPCLEWWTVHGAGHAWAGGQPGGSHVDPAGPDASTQMLRFFLALP